MIGPGEAPNGVVISVIGWALVHFLWQGLALGAIAATAMTLARSAAGRYAIGSATLLLMAAAPIATVALHRGLDGGLDQSLAPLSEASRAEATVSVIAPAHPVTAPTSGETPPPKSPQPTERSPSESLRWFVWFWLVGVALFSLRTAGGLLFLHRLRRRHSVPVEGKILEICDAAQKRLKIHRVVRYYRSTTLEAPAVIGWLRPIVLLPVSALTGLSEQQLRLIVAHELAHVQRLDPMVNALQIGVETLFFYHPAVWWLSRRVRIEREHCCDDIAIAACDGRLEYAQALTTLETLRQPPTLALAANGGSLRLRIARILGVQENEPKHRGVRLATSALLLTTALGAGVLLSGWAPHRVSLNTLDESQALPFAPTSSSPVSTERTVETATSGTPSTHEPAGLVSASAATGDTARSSEIGVENESPATPLGELPQPAFERVERDERPKTQSAERAESQVSSGPTVERDPDTRDAVQPFDSLPNRHRDAFRVHGVTPEYIREIRSLGLDPKPESLIAFRVHGVSPDYIRGLQATDLEPTVEELIAFRVHGVRVETLYAFDRAGLRLDSSDEVIALHVHGVTPEEVETRSIAGLSTDVDALLGMRIHGVTPAYVHELQALDLRPDSDELIAMKIHGISPELISGLLTAGLTLDPGELVRAKVHGVTPAFISAANAKGFDNLSLDEWIDLKRLDIVRPPATLGPYH